MPQMSQLWIFSPLGKMSFTFEEENQKEEIIVVGKLATYEQLQYEPLELHWTCIRFHIPHKENSLHAFGRGVLRALPWLKPEHQKCVIGSTVNLQTSFLCVC